MISFFIGELGRNSRVADVGRDASSDPLPLTADLPKAIVGVLIVGSAWRDRAYVVISLKS